MDGVVCVGVCVEVGGSVVVHTIVVYHVLKCCVSCPQVLCFMSSSAVFHVLKCCVSGPQVLCIAKLNAYFTTGPCCHIWCGYITVL